MPYRSALHEHTDTNTLGMSFSEIGIGIDCWVEVNVNCLWLRIPSRSVVTSAVARSPGGLHHDPGRLTWLTRLALGHHWILL